MTCLESVGETNAFIVPTLCLVRLDLASLYPVSDGRNSPTEEARHVQRSYSSINQPESPYYFYTNSNLKPPHIDQS